MIQQQRIVMILVGGLAGLSLYLVSLGIAEGLIEGRLAYAAALGAVSFLAGLLVMAGRIRLMQAGAAALGVALVLAALFSWAGMRFAEIGDSISAPIPVAASLILATLPLPFVIAALRQDWDDYPTLFAEAWGIVMRVTVAAVFVGLVWGIIFLCDALLSLVGVTLIGEMLSLAALPWVITGVVTGLALAVVLELPDYVTPFLVLRLLRLLVPAVLVVMVVFLVALPVRGLSGLFGGVSVAAVLLAISAAAATLVTAAVDQDDDGAVTVPLMRRATQALAGLTFAPAILAVWAIWMRVQDRGWTPNRVLLASVAVLGLGYGLLYLLALLRGRQWMDHIRQANIYMALAQICLAVLWLTPLLNPEAISARNQMARIVDGRTAVGDIDLAALRDWGVAGQGALAELQALADAGNVALAARLANDGAPVETNPDGASLLAALQVEMPLQPDGAETRALRDQILAQIDPFELQSWRDACAARLPQDAPGCVFVFADILPDHAGDEAIYLGRSGDGYLAMEGFFMQDNVLQRRQITSYSGQYPQFDQAGDLIFGLQSAAPALSPLKMNEIKSGVFDLTFSP